jgi:superfamily I DNA/RNA helicase
MSRVKRLYIAGDDDQSIYAFIGADRYGFLEHPVNKDEVLPKTWRLLDNVWNHAQRIITGVSRRHEKNIQTRGGGGEIEYYNCDISRVPISNTETTMFIARHNGQLDSLAQELTGRGIPFEGRGWQPYGSTAVRAIHALLSMRAGTPVPLREAALVLDRIGHKEEGNAMRGKARSAPDATITQHPLINVSADWVRYLARSSADITKNQVIRTILNSVGWPGVLEPPKVSLTTYHGSKGREADHVVLLTDCYRKAYDGARADPDDERRVAYVGVTRAKQRLSIILPQTDMFMRCMV